jgi:superoxide reductase
MTNLKEIYKCDVCGNIVEILHEGVGQLVCCNEPMKLQTENTVDAATEKHIPIIEGNKVIVGSTEHPMTEDHYIEWIEASSDSGMEPCKKFLNPEDSPEVKFPFPVKFARAYCNLHGLWKSE